MEIQIAAEMTSSFSNHYRYVVDIVLSNLVEFIKYYERNPDDVRTNSRLFMNAVVTMNHIPDYMFWEWKDDLAEINIKDEVKLYDHLIKIEGLEFMSNIREAANAAKHCVRKKDPTQLRASELAKTKMNMSVHVIPDEKKEYVEAIGMSSVKLMAAGYYKEHYSIVEKAFHFWMKYHNDQEKRKMYKAKILGKDVTNA